MTGKGFSLVLFPLMSLPGAPQKTPWVGCKGSMCEAKVAKGKQDIGGQAGHGRAGADVPFFWAERRGFCLSRGEAGFSCDKERFVFLMT